MFTSSIWPEVEALAEHNLVGLACTPYMPAVAPAGAQACLAQISLLHGHARQITGCL